ncbi:ATP-binding protein [Pseudomonas sp. GCM10022186]|uniref:ATP-binding protein n=1 Tax=Pseudomonas sp. GCM10022186 TaxID=3252650 RepID=UPI00360D3EA2
MEEEHPVVHTYFWMSSTEVARICSIASFKMYMRKTGVIFVGPSRLGKTRCCDILEKQTKITCPRAYVLRLAAVNREGNSKATIIQQLAFVLGVKPKVRDTRLKIFQMVVERLEFNMRDHGRNQLILLIDELQRFNCDDFYQLADLYNALDERRVRMTVISFAMPEIEDIRSDLSRSEQQQIIARFMSEIIPFNGLRSEQDIRVVLEYYDQNSEFPPGSGITYTQAFIPQAFGCGFRLGKLSGVLWKELNAVATGKYYKNLPMEHFMMCLKFILLVGERNDSETFTITKSLILEAIKESGLEEFCRKKE